MDTDAPGQRLDGGGQAGATAPDADAEDGGGGGGGEEEEDDGVDPLDAFMMDNAAQMVKDSRAEQAGRQRAAPLGAGAAARGGGGGGGGVAVKKEAGGEGEEEEVDPLDAFMVGHVLPAVEQDLVAVAKAAALVKVEAGAGASGGADGGPPGAGPSSQAAAAGAAAGAGRAAGTVIKKAGLLAGRGMAGAGRGVGGASGRGAASRRPVRRRGGSSDESSSDFGDEDESSEEEDDAVSGGGMVGVWGRDCAKRQCREECCMRCPESAKKSGWDEDTPWHHCACSSPSPQEWARIVNA